LEKQSEKQSEILHLNNRITGIDVIPLNLQRIQILPIQSGKKAILTYNCLEYV